jgi:hypothetical protein
MIMNGGVIPEPYATHWRDLTMCERYGCTPSQLDDEDAWRIELHQDIKTAVDSYIRYENKSEQRRAQRRG